VNPLKLLLILRARWKIALLALLLTVTAGVAALEFVPKRYTAETAVVVDIRSPDPVSAVLMPTMMVPGNLGTQIDIIKSDRVARKVARMLRLDQDTHVKAMWLETTGGKGKVEDWMSDLLLKGLKVSPSRDSSILTISYQGGDPTFAAAAANAFAQAYMEASIELKIEPARQYSQWFGEQAKILRENVERAQARLSDFQRQKGIVATDDNMDAEHAKLRELSTRLTAVQGDLRDAQSKQRTGVTSPGTLPEVMQNSAIQNLRASINQLEVKLKEAARNLGASHPQFQRMEAELSELRNRLAAETSHAVSSYSSSTAVARTKEAELKLAIDAQTKKVLNMKGERDEITVLMRDVETAKRAYEAVTTRLTQTNLESQANRTNVSVLTPAVEPIEPSFPPPLLKALLITLAASVVFAFGAALGAEFLDPRIRTAGDLGEMLQIPVLAVIERSKLPRRLAPPPTQRALPLK
jgi:polysaccharide biosynthesis transport protein